MVSTQVAPAFPAFGCSPIAHDRLPNRRHISCFGIVVEGRSARTLRFRRLRYRHRYTRKDLRRRWAVASLLLLPSRCTLSEFAGARSAALGNGEGDTATGSLKGETTARFSLATASWA